MWKQASTFQNHYRLVVKKPSFNVTYSTGQNTGRIGGFSYKMLSLDFHISFKFDPWKNKICLSKLLKISQTFHSRKKHNGYLKYWKVINRTFGNISLIVKLRKQTAALFGRRTYYTEYAQICILHYFFKNKGFVKTS